MSKMVIHNMPQNTPEWYAARLGIPTASNFEALTKRLKNGSPSKERTTYLYKLAGERITGEPPEDIQTYAMKRGHDMEPQAREFYSFMRDAEPELVGFVTNHGAGASPDSLIGNDGMLEIKTKAPHILLGCIEEGEDFPSDHFAQCQGQLWVAEREWVDLICYWPKMQPHIVRTYRDEAFIATLSEEVAKFNEDLEALVAKHSYQGEFA